MIKENRITLEDKLNERNLLEACKEVIHEHHCNIDKLEWKSTYNSYVVYDYQPFCPEGFNINLEISGAKHNVQFVNYLIEEFKKLNRMNERIKELVVLK